MSSNPRQDFVTFLQLQQYWDSIWNPNILTTFVNGIGSAQLNRLFTAWQAGNLTYIANWIIAESGHNMERPDWIDYKSNVYTPEIIFLTNAILDLKNRIAQYQATVPTSTQDQGLLIAMNNELDNLERVLGEYQVDLAAEPKP